MQLQVPEGYNEYRWSRALDFAELRGISDPEEVKKIYKELDSFEEKSEVKFSYYEVEVKGESEYYVEGYISTSALDLVNDIVTKDCMQDMLTQIKGGSIKLDFDHDTIKEGNLNKNPTGRIVDAKLDSKGIWVKALINKFNFEFKALWGSIKSGMIDAFSIAYQPIKKIVKNIKGKAVRFLEKVKLVNVALTGTPINPEAKMTNIFAKSMQFYENLEKKGIESKGITTQDLILLFKTFTDLLEKSTEIDQNEMLGYSQTNEFTDEMKKYAETGTEGKSESHSISDTENIEKMVEEKKQEELVSKEQEAKPAETEAEAKVEAETPQETEATEEAVETESAEVPEVKAEPKKEEAEDEEEEDDKKVDKSAAKMAERKSELESEIKALEDKKLALEKELSKPEFKGLAESSPNSIKSHDNKNRVNPLSLFA